MLKLIQNELLKILKRKSMYILLIVLLLIMISYNIIQSNFTERDTNIIEQYKEAYKQDKLYLENYESTESNDSYSEIIERLKLEEYAIENNIQYNILINSENENIPLPKDARYILLKIINNSDIFIILLSIFIVTLIFSEEYNKGTIKNVLIRPHKRTTILTSKLIVCILIPILTIIIVNILQFIIGGVIFGFDSYNLNAIIYDSQTQQISTLNLFNYIMQIWISKIPLYILLTLISILIGVNISNIATNILITLGIYAISKIDILNKYIISYYADFTNFLSNNITQKDFMHAILIVCSSMTIILILIIHKFKNKEINNEK